MALPDWTQAQALLSDAAGRATRYLDGIDERPVAPDEAARGTCWCGPTVWRQRPAMRISVSGWATTEHDIDDSAQAIIAAFRALR